MTGLWRYPSGCSDLLVISGKEEVPSGGLVTGIGQVHGRAVAIVANDATGEHCLKYTTQY